MKDKKSKRVNKKQIDPPQQSENHSRHIVRQIQKNRTDLLFLFIASTCFLGFGLFHLGKFFITDEIVWLYKRYPMFWTSLLDGGWGRFNHFGAQSGILQILLSPWVFFVHNIRSYDYSNFEQLMFKWRLPLLLFNYFLLFIIFDRMRRLWNNRVATGSIVLMAFFPYLVGISQIFNKDTTLWSTAIVSILNFYLYLDTKQYRFATYAGIFLGLALLSKFPASILYPVYFGFIYLEYILFDANSKTFVKTFLGYCVCVGISMLIVFIALPPAWGNLQWLLKWTWYSQVIKSYTNYIFAAILILSAEIIVLKGIVTKKVHDLDFLKIWVPKVLFGTFFLCLCFAAIVQLFNIESYFHFLDRNIGTKIPIQTMPRSFFSGFLAVTGNAPLIHIFGIFGFLILMLKKNADGDSRDRFFFYSMVLIMVYYAGSAMAGVDLSVRYQIILIPVFCIFASCFFVTFLRKNFYLFLTIFCFILTAEMVHVAPFYISYNNPVDFSSFKNPGVGWGQGGYEIAKSANQLQNASNLKILSDYEGFARFFRGSGFRYAYHRKLFQDFIREFDYLCLSSSGFRQMSRYGRMTSDIKKYYDEPLNEAVRFIGNDQDYVKLVKVE